jgi:hypothetical protein
MNRLKQLSPGKVELNIKKAWWPFLDITKQAKTEKIEMTAMTSHGNQDNSVFVERNYIFWFAIFLQII